MVLANYFSIPKNAISLHEMAKITGRHKIIFEFANNIVNVS
jgi:hypothetical protein